MDPLGLDLIINKRKMAKSNSQEMLLHVCLKEAFQILEAAAAQHPLVREDPKRFVEYIRTSASEILYTFERRTQLN